MLKEVGTSGQISLGKKFAGQLFDMSVQQDGSIVMCPVKVVPATISANQPQNGSGDARQNTNPATTTREWADANAANIDQYNAWASQREPYSQRVRRWRATEKDQKNGGGA